MKEGKAKRGYKSKPPNRGPSSRPGGCASVSRFVVCLREAQLTPKVVEGTASTEGCQIHRLRGTWVSVPPRPGYTDCISHLQGTHLHCRLSPLLPQLGSVTDGQWGSSQPLPPAPGRTEDARSTCWVDTSKCREEKEQGEVTRGGACSCAGPWNVPGMGSAGGPAAGGPCREPAHVKCPPSSPALPSGFLELQGWWP